MQKIADLQGLKSHLKISVTHIHQFIQIFLQRQLTKHHLGLFVTCLMLLADLNKALICVYDLQTILA